MTEYDTECSGGRAAGCEAGTAAAASVQSASSSSGAAGISAPIVPRAGTRCLSRCWHVSVCLLPLMPYVVGRSALYLHCAAAAMLLLCCAVLCCALRCGAVLRCAVPCHAVLCCANSAVLCCDVMCLCGMSIRRSRQAHTLGWCCHRALPRHVRHLEFAHGRCCCIGARPRMLLAQLLALCASSV